MKIPTQILLFKKHNKSSFVESKIWTYDQKGIWGLKIDQLSYINIDY